MFLPSPRRRFGLWISLGALLLAAPSAPAHLVSSGVGPFYDGVAHFFLTAEDLVIVMTLALLGALGGQPAARRLVLVLPLAWLAGSLVGHRFSLPNSLDLVPSIGTLLTGLLVAINPRLPTSVPALLAGVLGFLHGSLNGQAMAGTRTPFLAAFGIVSALAVVGLLIAAIGISLQRPWQRVAMRVLGSWASAIGLLALAWQIRPGA